MWCIQLIGVDDNIYVGGFCNTLADIQETTWEGAKLFLTKEDADKWAKKYCTSRKYKLVDPVGDSIK